MEVDDIDLRVFNFQNRKLFVHGVTHHATDSFQSGIINEVISDLYEKLKNGKRADTFFFKIVHGGDHHLISAILSVLKASEHARCLKWLLGGTIQNKEKLCQRGITTFLFFTMLALVTIVFTPVFYLCHMIMSTIWIKLFARCNNPPSLPLALVCLSRSKRMFKLFQDEGLHMTDTDESNNNVIHFLATLSRDDPEGAILIWDLLLKVFQNADMKSLCNSPNNLGLTPLELTARVGSVQFLNHMLESKRLTKTVILKVKEGYTYMGLFQESFQNDQESDSIHPCHHSIQHQKMIVAKYDITKFESGDVLRNQSILLNMLSQVDAIQLNKSEVESMTKDTLLSQWIKLKNRMYMSLRTISNAVNIIMTGLILFYMILTGGDSNTYPLASLHFHTLLNVMSQKAVETLNFTDQIMNDISVGAAFQWCGAEEAYVGSFNLRNWCYQLAMANVSSRCKSKLSPDQIVFDTGILIKEDTEALLGITRWTLVGIISMYFLNDLITRLVYLWKNLYHFQQQCGFSAALNRIIICTIPGSYIGKQLSVLAFSLFLSSTIVQVFYTQYVIQLFYLDPKSSMSSWINEMEGQYIYVRIMSLLTTICLFLRFISLIYSLRLLPSFGHFVIITFKMTETLLQFLVVYFFILVAFGSIFHFLLRDPSCPSIRVENYDSVVSSSVETFLLMLGMADFPSNTSDLAKGAYIFYLLVSAIVLLNLIIAVMTIVVEGITNQPHKKAIHLLHHLTDALSVETFLHLITYPFVSRVHKGFLRRAGYTVEQKKVYGVKTCCAKDKFAVSIERFYQK